MSLELASSQSPILPVEAARMSATEISAKERIFIHAFLRNIWWSMRTILTCLAVDDSPLPQEGLINLDVFPVHDTLISEDNILVVETLGKHPVGWGGSSDVWKGRLVRSTYPSTQAPLVAAKVLRIWTDRTKVGKTLRQEIKIWKLLDHPSISTFYGVVYNADGAPAIISPWYENGSADVYLRQHPEINPLKLIREVVLGLEYLHDRGIIHADMKPVNVMVDNNGHAKLIDFGLSRLIDSATGMTGGMTMTTVAFSVRWCAPEILLSQTGQITTAVDVYAWASTSLQLLTGEVPYANLPDRTVLSEVMNKTPPKISTIPLRHAIPNLDEFWKLLALCWLDHLDRPSIAEVKHKMLDFFPELSLI